MRYCYELIAIESSTLQKKYFNKSVNGKW